MGSLHIESNTQRKRLLLAMELIRSGEGRVVLDERIVIDRRGDRTECAVITRFRNASKPEVFESKIEEGRRLPSASSVSEVVREPLDWIALDCR